MKHRIGKYEFSSGGEYKAAKRDEAKVRGMARKGKTSGEIASNYLRQIREEDIVFETRLGEDFKREAERIASFDDMKEAEQLHEEDRYVVSKKKTVIRNVLLLILYILLAIVVFMIGMLVQKEYSSRKQLEKLQGSVNEQRSSYSSSSMVSRDDDQESSEANESGMVSENGEMSLDPSEELITDSEQVREVLPQFTELLRANPDFAGWLTIPGTVIDYPVMYREHDNEFYLSHNFEGEEDDSGLLVLDKRCDRDGSGVNHLIHGHNMNSGAMFGSLTKYLDTDYWRDHSLILFSTLYEERVYEIFAVFQSTVYDENTTDFPYYDYIKINDREQFDRYVKSVKEQSVFDTGIDAEYGDALITLSTCENSRKDGRLVIVGRRINE